REAFGRGVISDALQKEYPPPQPSPTSKSDVSDLERSIMSERGNTRVQMGKGADRTPAQCSEKNTALTWLALEPITGRTHQLRVHCAAMGFPIVGDPIYGTQASLRRLRNESTLPQDGSATLHLHAREIVVPLSKNKPPVRVIAPVPDHMRERLTRCGWKE